MNGGRDARIIECSNELFIRQGYKATTMRQLAEAADTSLGLSTYHFRSKRNIAICIMTEYLKYLKTALANLHNAQKSPLSHSAAMVRLCMEFFMSQPCKQFYLECLELEIYMESIKSLGVESSSSIAKAFNLDVKPDLLLLFDNYVPPSVERILIIEKNRGLFQGITWDEIPDIIFGLTMERYIDKVKIKNASKKGKEIARKVLETIPSDITKTLFLDNSPSCISQGPSGH